MKKHIKSYIDTEMKRYFEGRDLVKSKRDEWKDFQRKSEDLFSEYVSAVQDNGYKHWLYMDSTKENKLSDFDHKYITLFFGLDSTGLYKLDNEDRPKIDHQGGCALHISQLVTGDVSVLFYPFQSDLYKANEDSLLYGIYSSPNRVSQQKLDFFVKLLFSYARGTSYGRNIDVLDRLRIRWMKIRHWRYGRGKSGLIKSLLDAALQLAGLVKPTS